MIKEVRNPILPSTHQFAEADGPNELYLEAICVYVALGFFLGEDTFWKNKVCLKPAHNHSLEGGRLIKSEPNFHWHYSPRSLSFNNVLEEYNSLLRTIIEEQVQNNSIILPLSGGLDSRSLAAVLSTLNCPVSAFGYSFENGYAEHKIAMEIANTCGFDFKEFIIGKGYLWNKIDALAKINGCYSEFTHPRQMAITDDFVNINGDFLLGHWGDVLFDRGVPEGTTEEELIPLLFKKIVKKHGFSLANKLWQTWNIEGDFKDYLTSRFKEELFKIKIENLSAKVRAFKTTHWAHRWTTTNLSVFNSLSSIKLPYYDNRMIEFICTVPEEYLADRRLQIAHLKTYPKLAQITWEDQAPFNLFNYSQNKIPFNLPYRIKDKMKRTYNALNGKDIVLRNWELQFIGEENEEHLKSYILNKEFNQFISKDIVEEHYNGFKNVDPRHYAHSISMLLTLSVWHNKMDSW